jgi:biotin carboxyl carrier protein
MRNYRITINGKTYLVEIADPNAAPVQVRVNGKPFQVHVDWEGADDEATLTPEIRPAEEATPSAGPGAGRRVTASQQRVREEEGATADRVTAPMPGTILSVAVKQGDQVQPGRVLCVLEAMKMKNSIRSPREGTIAEVATSAGAAVAHGDLLVRFE